MALITAVFGSVLGLVFGTIGMIAFGLTLFEAFIVYMGASLSVIAVGAVALFRRSKPQEARSDPYEAQLDAEWRRLETEMDALMANAPRSETEPKRTSQKGVG